MLQTLDDWRRSLVLRAYSPRTVAAYVREVRLLARCFPGAPGSLSRAGLESYLAERRLALADASYRLCVVALRSFLGWALGRRSPARAVVLPRVARSVRPRRSLDAEQAAALLASVDTSTTAGVRDLALLALMIDTGLRAAEVCRLTIADLGRDLRGLSVVVKGGRVAAAWLSPEVADLLGWWLSVRQAAPGCVAVFVSLGGVLRGQALTPRGLGKLLQRRAGGAGVARLAPHDLRRTFAHLALRAGAPTRLVQVAGRWGSLREVERVYSRDLVPADLAPWAPAGRILRRRGG